MPANVALCVASCPALEGKFFRRQFLEKAHYYCIADDSQSNPNPSEAVQQSERGQVRSVVDARIKESAKGVYQNRIS